MHTSINFELNGQWAEQEELSDCGLGGGERAFPTYSHLLPHIAGSTKRTPGEMAAVFNAKRPPSSPGAFAPSGPRGFGFMDTFFTFRKKAVSFLAALGTNHNLG